jgi:carboxylesterase
MLHRLVFLLLIVLLSCKKKEHLPPIDNAIELDGNQVNDSSLIDPASFLLSAATIPPGQDSAFKQKQVFIAVHGFSASNFEWQEFSSWCKTKPDVLVSRVLLGGHGRDYADFRKATWVDWQRPIIEEYNRLVTLGYTKINFIAASTGCPLVLEMLKEKKISDSKVNKVFFVDPIIVPSNKQLSLAPLVGGTVIHYTETELSPAENGYWYKYRPQEALKQLNTLTRDLRRDLEKGVQISAHITTTVYKSERDGSADPVSATIIERGLNNCTVKMIDSDLHVFTRLKGREQVKENDRELQLKTFDEIYAAL